MKIMMATEGGGLAVFNLDQVSYKKLMDNLRYVTRTDASSVVVNLHRTEPLNFYEEYPESGDTKDLGEPIPVRLKSVEVFFNRFIFRAVTVVGDKELTAKVDSSYVVDGFISKKLSVLAVSPNGWCYCIQHRVISDFVDTCSEKTVEELSPEKWEEKFNKYVKESRESEKYILHRLAHVRFNLENIAFYLKYR